MLTACILSELEDFLRAEGKKSLSEYRDSAASQKRDWMASILEHIAGNINNCDPDLIRSVKLRDAGGRWHYYCSSVIA
jgi:hypothetical protein